MDLLPFFFIHFWKNLNGGDTDSQGPTFTVRIQVVEATRKKSLKIGVLRTYMNNTEVFPTTATTTNQQTSQQTATTTVTKNMTKR